MRIVKTLYDYILFFVFGSVRFARTKGVAIGNNCRVYIKNWGSEPFLVELGNDVTITSGVKFITHDGSTCLIKNSDNYRYQKYGKIIVGNNVFIGVNTILLPGVSVGSNVIIGAGSLVNKNLESNYVYAGVPAKKIMSFTDYHKKISESCSNNEELKNISDYQSRVFKAIEIQNEKS